MLLAIVISRLFPKFLMRKVYAKTSYNSHLSISSTSCVVGISVDVSQVCQQ